VLQFSAYEDLLPHICIEYTEPQKNVLFKVWCRFFVCVEQINRLYNEPRTFKKKHFTVNLCEDIGSRGNRAKRLKAGIKNVKSSRESYLSLLI